MSKKKGGGTAKNGRDSAGRRLGVKVHASQSIRSGGIIIRQRGTKFLPGANVRRGKDDTLYAVADGKVKFEYISRIKQRVTVVPAEAD
ncbi:MAG TPA: 50S ribosomal protein L27 [candidate division WOR-3 bacterium]|uniref:Large ribosomal subunit protein bL27 n=1 Tax=candidate division WOR-3 bacterium TaxID=2052148 RepID=A0A7V0XFF2_UNCW3|nr:50S ribosomal protein L27 [candidate division WOR-3 bacterium]